MKFGRTVLQVNTHRLTESGLKFNFHQCSKLITNFWTVNCWEVIIVMSLYQQYDDGR